ncbi:MAG: flagellar type III secretion system pore protein FliP [Deferribacteres bacterium]|nr:flagellar type III secretion system pore protein FliP [candidate division KSB1 bacterium]MCB9501938.1 flagellar type III secretion system pore protein FliP [Deferribacteres bacterium]
MPKRTLIIFFVIALLMLAALPEVSAQSVPKVSINIDKAQEPRDVALALEILFLFTILTLAPSFLIMMTSFTRIVVVLHFVRQAIGIQQMPPNQILLGLSLFLTFFVMQPVFNEVYQNAFQPYVQEEISSEQAIERGISPLREFMLKQTREKDLALFVKLSKSERPKNREDIGTLVLVPSFIISEMRRAFEIGFLLYIPFLMIDMIVASILMSMGMMMLPPMMISLPFKLLLFVLVDGWYLLIGSLVEGFG